jgi:thioesterase domain-containing protein
MSIASLRPALAEVLAAELPITQSLGIGVVEAGLERVVLSLPLAANRNHKGAVFAGSLNAVATLAGWSLLWVALRQNDLHAHVVIQDATVRYLEPARSDVRAECTTPPTAAVPHALEVLARRGRARVTLEATVRDAEGTVVATLSGRYVVHRREP